MIAAATATATTLVTPPLSAQVSAQESALESTQDDPPPASAGQHVIADAFPGDTFVLELTSGDRLSVTLTQILGDRWLVEHAMIGSFEIPLDSIQRIIHRTPVADDSTASIDHTPPNTQQNIQADQADHAGQAGQAGHGSEDTSDPAPLQPTAPELPEATPSPWDYRLELGGNFQTGNTDAQSGRITLNATRQVPENTLRLDTGMRFAVRDGDRTENRVTAGAFSEWPRLESKWSTFAQSRYDIDEFESWDSRLTASGGVSYHFIDKTERNEADQVESALALSMRVGAGFRQEFGSLEEDIVPEGVLGANFNWAISPRQRVSANSTLFPDLTSSGEYRVLSNLDWSLDIDQMDGVSLKIGLAHEFESITDPGIENNDISAYATIVLDF